ncbi:MAG: WYL domain-containing protein [Paludibacteraceae bacterium]|nr:WYL domain-containing protein [Paludibacteraceae bacterium]
MAKNKGAAVRYRTIDRCLRDTRRKYGVKELSQACARELTTVYSTPIAVSIRQIYTDLNYIESLEGFGADIQRIRDGKKVYMRYADPEFSIERSPLNNEETDQLRETIQMLNRFKGMPHFEWMEETLSRLEDSFRLTGSKESVIAFEQNTDMKGLEYIKQMFNAIVTKSVLNLRYKSFQSYKPAECEFHPYFLKQYDSRWFVFGLKMPQNEISNFALDCIESISQSIMPYIAQPANLNFNNYFDDVVGVTVTKEPVRHIVIRVSGERYPYIKNKPLHHTQHNYDREMKITIDVRPNKELITMLLSLGSQIEVLEPQEVRDMMREHVRTMNRFYK